jgi:hypothetical protein
MDYTIILTPTLPDYFRTTMKTLASALLVTLALAGGAQAQGLLSIGANNDFDEKLPFTVTIASTVGYDSNMNSSAFEETDSVYLQNGVSLYFPMGDRRNHLALGAHYSNIYYFDPAPGTEDMYHNARFTLNYTRKLSPRAQISNSLYVSYENEPDYLVGASTARRTEQYFYGYNSLQFSYQWTRRFSTTTGYTISAIMYDETQFEINDRISHLFSQEFRYAFSKQTTGTLDYRYGITEFDDNVGGDSTSHYVLAGVDHAFSPTFTASARAGVQFAEYDGAGDQTAPYFEGALNYRVAKLTTLRWYHALGFDDSESNGSQTNLSYRTGLTLDQKLSEQLSLNLSLNYVHSEYENSSVFSDFSDNLFAGAIGIDYRVWRNVGLNVNYSYVTATSDLDFREFDRHRISGGLTATF